MSFGARRSLSPFQPDFQLSLREARSSAGRLRHTQGLRNKHMRPDTPFWMKNQSETFLLLKGDFKKMTYKMPFQRQERLRPARRADRTATPFQFCDIVISAYERKVVSFLPETVLICVGMLLFGEVAIKACLLRPWISLPQPPLASSLQCLVKRGV